MPKRLLFVLVALTLAASAAAQSSAPPSPSKLHLDWDLVLRYDRLKDIPAKPYNYSYDRWHLQLRPGASYTFNSLATVEARLALHKDSEPTDHYPLADQASGYYHDYKLLPGPEHGHLLYGGREDNFTPNGIRLDRLNLQLRPTPSTFVAIGRFENPFDFTQATWDVDLQPQGIAGTWDIGAEDSFHSRVGAGAFYATQQYGDTSKIFGGQYSAMSSSQWPVGFDLSLGYFDYTDLDVWGRKNFRSNATVEVNGVRRYVSDFEIGDALLRLRSDRWYPVEVWYDRIHNFGAAPGAGANGVDTGFRVGQLAGAGTFRFSYIYQDLQRDAVMDAFNGDDWYLHSWYRGSLYRLGLGLWRDFSVQATYMDMRHHETDFHTTRWMFDLVKRW